MPLRDDEIRGFKPAEKPYKKFDGGGLYVLVERNGSKYWRYKFRLHGKEDVFPIGVYPEVSIKRARVEHTWARGCVDKGLSPNAVRKKEKEEAAAQLAAALGQPSPVAVMGENAGPRALPGDTFEEITKAWKETYIASRGGVDEVGEAREAKGKRKKRKRRPLSPDTIGKLNWLIDTYLLPKLGDNDPELRALGPMHVTQITTAILLPRILKVERDGKSETAHRMRQRYNKILRWAKAIGKLKTNPAADLEGALQPNVHEKHPGLTDPAAVGALIYCIDGYKGWPQTQHALKLWPHLFLRPWNLRKMKWKNIDLDAAEIRIGPDDMKMDEKFIIPLSRQAVAILRSIHRTTGSQEFVFGSTLHTDRPMSENTINGALRRMGYSGDEMTGHGVRTLASTLLNDHDDEFHPDAIELQLAHAGKDKVRIIYNEAKRLKHRRKMMQTWSDYLDELKAAHIERMKRLRQAA